MKPDIVSGDIVEQASDGIVNAWNRNIIPWWLLIPQGVAGAIRRAAGTVPFREIARTGPLPLGEARLTSAGRLPNKGIIHVAGISMWWRSSETAIRDCTRNAVRVAEGAGFASLAMPVIGAGTGGFDEPAALAIMIDELAGIDTPVRVRILRHGRGLTTTAIVAGR